MTVHGRRVLITGAAGSLGTALTMACAQRGCSLILIDLDRDALARAAQRLSSEPPAPRCLALDVTDPTAVRRAFEQLTAEGQMPELVINNAAMSLYGNFADVPPNAWMRLLDVNLRGAMTVTQAALPAMLAQRRGHVVFISSLSGLCASGGLAAYAASKHALHGFAESLYLELRPRGIGVSVVCPSTLRSDIAARMGIHLGPSATKADIETWRARRARVHQTRGIPCERVAARCLRAVDRGRFLELIGWDAHLAVLAKRILGSRYWPLLALAAGRKNVPGSGEC